MIEEQNGFNFSTEPLYWDFSIGDTKYRLKEAGEDGVIAYKNCSLQHLVAHEKGESKILSASGGAEADSILISKCLFTLEGDNETPVSPQKVKALPHRITSRLYKWIRKNSGMDEEQETEEFLAKRIASDTKKLASLKEGVPGKGEQSSTNDS